MDLVLLLIFFGFAVLAGFACLIYLIKNANVFLGILAVLVALYFFLMR